MYCTRKYVYNIYCCIVRFFLYTYTTFSEDKRTELKYDKSPFMYLYYPGIISVSSLYLHSLSIHLYTIS